MTSRNRISLITLLLLIGGCSSATNQAPTHQTVPMLGVVKGGQQPITGAAINMYAAGSNGDGGAATALLTQAISTNSSGAFTLSSLYNCPFADAEIYITATGGNPGLSGDTTNRAIVLMAALGKCSQLSPSTFININEVTTVAAVAALAPFMSAPASISSSPSGSITLDSEFGLSSQFVNYASGTAPGTNVPTGYVVPTAKINTLANIIASCVNSTGGVAGDTTSCGKLFDLATLSGGTAPTTTAAALLNIASLPTINTAGLFALATPTSPFQPQLSEPPSDFAIQLTPQSSAMAGTLTITPSAGVVFGATPIGTASGPQTISLLNSGSTDISIQNISISGPSTADFSLTSTCVTTLISHANCTVAVTFVPGANGARNATLTVTSTAGNSPASVPFSGSGTGGMGGGGSAPPTTQVAGAYILSGSSWIPLTTNNSVGAIPYIPQSTNLYCLNTSFSQWAPCTNTSADSTGSAIPKITALLKGDGTGNAIAASAQDVANVITGVSTSQYLSSQNPLHPGTFNVVMGYAAGSNLSSGTGSNAGTGGQANVLIGASAGSQMTTARESVVIGSQAGSHITGNGTGSDDMITVLIGSLAGASLTNLGGADVMIGQKAGLNDLNAGGDTFIGIHAATAFSRSENTVVIGGSAANGDFQASATSERNTFVGAATMSGNGPGDKQDNTAVGYSDLYALSTGAGNTVVGSESGLAITTGSRNTVVGSNSGNGSMSGTGNVLLGSGQVGSLLTTGSNNLISNAIGGAAGVTSGSDNVLLGRSTAGGLRAGNYNVMIGVAAGQNSSDISNSVFVGRGSGLSASVDSLTFVGQGAGQQATSGGANSAFGHLALTSLTTGAGNTAVGDNALSQMSGSESNNVGVGANAQVAAGVNAAAQLGAGLNSLSNSLQFQTSTVVDDSGRIHSSIQTPTSSNSPCRTGAIWSDASFVYVCTAPNTVARAALVGFGAGSPTVVPGPASASGSSVIVTGTDVSGVITLIIGGGAVGTGPAVSITFSKAFQSPPQACSLTPRNAQAAMDVTGYYSTAPSGGGWTINSTGLAMISSGAVLQWSYICL